MTWKSLLFHTRKAFLGTIFMVSILNRIDYLLSSLSARFWIWFVILGLMMTFGIMNTYYLSDWPNINILLSSVDSDVWLRLTKVRELIQDGNFYNHAVIATNAPIGGIETPWTRPLDFILIFLYQFTPTDFSIEKRLILVASWYPLIIGALIIFFMSKASDSGFKVSHKFIVMILCLVGYLINSQTLNYFLPGNADHHSLQTLLWCISIWLILESPQRITAAFLGIVMGIWVWISPEALPHIFTIFIILGLKSLFKPDLSIFPLITSITLTLVVLIGLFIEILPQKIMSFLAYDTLSIIHLILFSFCFVGFFVVHFFVSGKKDLKTRLILAGGLATLLSSFFLGLFPKFIKGLLVDSDPYIFTNFLPFIREAQPLLNAGVFVWLPVLSLSALSLYLSIIYFKKSPYLLPLLVVPLIMCFFQLKWNYYVVTISIIIIAKCLPSYMHYLKLKYKGNGLLFNAYGIVFSIQVLIFVLSPYLVVKSYSTLEIANCEGLAFQSVQNGSLVKALRTSPLIIESNIFGNSGIPFFTPYHYVAGYYHREGMGMKIQHSIFFKTKTEKDVLPFLKDRKINALLICPNEDTSLWFNKYFKESPTKDSSFVKNNKLEFPPNTPETQKPILLMVKTK